MKFSSHQQEVILQIMGRPPGVTTLVNIPETDFMPLWRELNEYLVDNLGLITPYGKNEAARLGSIIYSLSKLDSNKRVVLVACKKLKIKNIYIGLFNAEARRKGIHIVLIKEKLSINAEL